MSDQDAHGADDLDPDEPRTPWWMPLLGGFLFLMAALFALIATDGAPEEETAEEPAGALEAPGAPHEGHGHPPGDHAGHNHPGHGHPGHDHGHDH